MFEVTEKNPMLNCIPGIIYMYFQVCCIYIAMKIQLDLMNIDWSTFGTICIECRSTACYVMVHTFSYFVPEIRPLVTYVTAIVVQTDGCVHGLAEVS